MAREQEYEWVNAWASASGAATDTALPQPQAEKPAPQPVPAQPPQPTLDARVARFVVAKPDTGSREEATTARSAIAPPSPDQLMRDIAEIERARDALAAGPAGRHVRTFMLVPASNGRDVAPLLVGGVLALVMLTVFGAAAAVGKFGR